MNSNCHWTADGSPTVRCALLPGQGNGPWVRGGVVLPLTGCPGGCAQLLAKLKRMLTLSLADVAHTWTCLPFVFLVRLTPNPVGGGAAPELISNEGLPISIATPLGGHREL